jgi:hypothetical protein
MKKHAGMRPQDIAILLKIIALENQDWQQKEIAVALHISASEVTESLKRSAFAGLFFKHNQQVARLAFYDFLIYGFRYVFPQQPGPMAIGIPTAHSAPPLNDQFYEDGIKYIWPTEIGSVKGQSIEPLYAGAPAAASEDPVLYELLALIDALRVGQARERKLAVEALKKRILYATEPQS